jgi:hypothetical protein
VYALLIDTYPEILSEIKFEESKEIQVAAQLIRTNTAENPKISVETIEGQLHEFNLNLSSRTLHSKGNWMWIKQLNIYYPSNLLLAVQLKPRIIDIPYASNNSVCAYWLFKHLYTDLIDHLNAIYTHS